MFCRTKHELTIPEVGDDDSRAVEQESHHPLLGDMSRKSQSSLLQICQSMHSVHAEAEAAAFMAMETVKDSSSVNRSLPTNGTQSPADVDSSTTLLDCSEVSTSLTNINEKYQYGTNIHIVAEDAAQITNAGSFNNVSYTEFGTTDNSTSDDVKNKQNQNNFTDPDTETANSCISHINNSSLIDYNEMKETNKTVHSVEEDQKNIECRIVDAKTEEANERICTCVDRLCYSGRFRKYSLLKLLRYVNLNISLNFLQYNEFV